MSTAALVLLAACVGGLPGGFSALRSADRQVQVANGSITLVAPAGFCVDRSAGRDTAQGAFMLFGSCASIKNDARLAAPRFSGVLTASVSSESGVDIDSSMERLSGFFSSVRGRAALARDGRAASVTVLATRRVRGAFMIRLRDTSPNTVGGLAQEYWRALIDVRGRIVTLSALAFQDRAVPDAVGFATLAGFVARVRQQNPTQVDPIVDPV